MSIKVLSSVAYPGGSDVLLVFTLKIITLGSQVLPITIELDTAGDALSLKFSRPL